MIMLGLSHLTLDDWTFIGLLSGGFFYGIYSAIFFMYFHFHISEKSMDKRPTSYYHFLFSLYPICFICCSCCGRHKGTTHTSIVQSRGHEFYIFSVMASILSGCCDFIGQSILVYRCWIIWNRNIYIVIIPSILAFVFLVLWLAGFGSEVYDSSQKQLVNPEWGYLVNLISIGMSLAVNALVTGLIVFKIFKVYREVKPLFGQTFGDAGGSRLRPILFVIIESGLALLSIQLAYIVVVLVQPETQSSILVKQPIIRIQRILNGITPTIIQVWVSMGLFFHDKESMKEVTSGPVRFGSVNGHQNLTDSNRFLDHEEDRGDDNSVPQCNGNSEIDQQDIDSDNNTGVRRSNDF